MFGCAQDKQTRTLTAAAGTTLSDTVAGAQIDAGAAAKFGAGFKTSSQDSLTLSLGPTFKRENEKGQGQRQRQRPKVVKGTEHEQEHDDEQEHEDEDEDEDAVKEMRMLQLDEEDKKLEQVHKQLLHESEHAAAEENQGHCHGQGRSRSARSSKGPSKGKSAAGPRSLVPPYHALRDEPRRAPSRWSTGPSQQRQGCSGAILCLDNLALDDMALLVYSTRIDEIGRLLRTNEHVPRSPERSPSPDPMYGTDGKRINMRDQRYRKRLEDERHKLVSYATSLRPSYRPPPDYHRPGKLTEKVYIPVQEHQGINFIGQILGPRGNDLKKMEAKCNARIAIRGKGSVKEGKGAPASYQNQEEDLHCLITADSEDKIKHARRLILEVIETAVNVPEEQNELKRQQLRDLAALNGTLRDDENQVCQNCGGIGHKKYNCPERSNITNNIVCRLCGGVGHMARDCMARNNPEMLAQARENDNRMDSEYMSLMAELGVVDAPPSASAADGAFSHKSNSNNGSATAAISNPNAKLPPAPWMQQKPAPGLSTSSQAPFSHEQRLSTDESGLAPPIHSQIRPPHVQQQQQQPVLRFAPQVSNPPLLSTSHTQVLGQTQFAAQPVPVGLEPAPLPETVYAYPEDPALVQSSNLAAPPVATPTDAVTQGVRPEDYTAYYQYYYNYALQMQRMQLQQQQQQQQVGAVQPPHTAGIP